MPYVEVNIDLDEFDTQDLLDELQKRLTRKKMKPDQVRKLNELAGFFGEIDTQLPEAKTIDEEMKIEWFANHFENITLEQLESLAK